MSDFYLHIGIPRGDLALALSDNPEQALWVLAELADMLSIKELREHAAELSPAPDVAAFYRAFADAVDPDIETETTKETTR
jgi:hypothetical protein